MILVLFFLMVFEPTIAFTFHSDTQLSPKFGYVAPIKVYKSNVFGVEAEDVIKTVYLKLEAPKENIFSQLECNCDKGTIRSRIYRPYNQTFSVKPSIFKKISYDPWKDTKKGTLGYTMWDEACRKDQ